MSLLSTSRLRSPLALAATAVVVLLGIGGVAPAANAAGSSLVLDRTTYTPGQSVVATYSTNAVSSTNWIGIYNSRDTPGGPASLTWVYAPSGSGSVTFSTSSLTPGSYRAHFLSNGGYTALAPSVFFTIVSATTLGTPTSAVCVGQTSYQKGQQVRVSYATAAASSTNWVGIYPDGQQPQSGSLGWAYAPGGNGAVSLSTSGLAEGSYQAYLLANDGYVPLATRAAKFTVTAPGGTSSPNLIVNGDGECGDPSASGYDSVTLPGWRQSGMGTAVSYDAGHGFPGPSTPGPANRGGAFFSGGPIGNTTLTQTADVSSAATAIDGGSVTYNLSGWLGGYAGEISTAKVQLDFRNAAGSSLGTGQIGPVTAADRGNTTELLQRAASGPVPANTRSIGISLVLAGDPARNRSNAYNDAYADNLSLTLSTTSLSAPSLPAPIAASTPQFDHVFFVMLENRSYNQVIGNSQAPYLTQLAANNVTFSHSYGAVHPSDPNYMAVAGGSTYGHVDNPMPRSIGELTGKHLGDLVENKGKSWNGYIEDMGSSCNLKSNGNFDADDMPFLFFRSLAGNPQRCLDHIHPITQLWTDVQSTSTTPNFVWFEPNSCNSMHNCSTKTGDDWFKNNLSRILTSPAWTTQRSLLIIQFDEDDDASDQRIPTIIAGSQSLTKAGYTSPTRCTQYSISRVMEQALGLPYITQNDQFADPLNDIWR